MCPWKSPPSWSGGWKMEDTARDPPSMWMTKRGYVHLQSEAAIRHVASLYAYDRSSSSTLQLLPHELECFALGSLDFFAVASGQAMFRLVDFMKLMGHAVLLQFLRHQL